MSDMYSHADPDLTGSLTATSPDALAVSVDHQARGHAPESQGITPSSDHPFRTP
ncbi:hypothetical protein [Streptomyces pluripotens]|uniref:hypothetical protein n=1 Tax=Streptomyces pluripotens TaxID=1355015 RepID=UPI000A6BF028|nr:hypothetical protein [Streptomyces pluripotens]